MASVQQVQSVAKRLEKMLETSLNQLKIEQKLRKESENKLMDLELDLVNKEHLIRSLEDQIVNIKSEKDEKIINLESTINFLQSVVIQKEKEVFNMQEVLAKYNTDGVNLNLDRTVEKYEATLSQLIGGENQDADDDDHNDVSDVLMDNITDIIEGDYSDSKEYILDDSMEDLIDNGSISEQIEPMAIEDEEKTVILSKNPNALFLGRFSSTRLLYKNIKSRLGTFSNTILIFVITSLKQKAPCKHTRQEFIQQSCPLNVVNVKRDLKTRVVAEDMKLMTVSISDWKMLN